MNKRIFCLAASFDPPAYWSSARVRTVNSAEEFNALSGAFPA